MKATRKLPVLGGDARKRRVWGFSDETKANFVETDDSSAETLGSICRGLWWSELANFEEMEACSCKWNVVWV